MAQNPVKHTYSGDPAQSNRDTVRFLIQDTDEDKPLLKDDEIDYLISSEPNLTIAAAKGCEILATKFTREIDRSVIGMSATVNQRPKFYLDMAQRLRAQANRKATVFAGGLSFADKRSFAEDADLVQSSFSVGQDDHPMGPTARHSTDDDRDC